IENARHVRVVHHRHSLALVVEARQHLAGVHAELYDFQSDLPPDRFGLPGEVNGSHAPLAEHANDFITAEAVLFNRFPHAQACGFRFSVTLLESGFEGPAHEADRAQISRIVGIQFGATLWARLHAVPRLPDLEIYFINVAPTVTLRSVFLIPSQQTFLRRA